MYRFLSILLLIITITSCTHTNKNTSRNDNEVMKELALLSYLSIEVMEIKGATKDKSYGRSIEAPIKIYDGKTQVSTISRNHAFLFSLRYKNKPIKWKRVGSVKGKKVILDKYEILKGSKKDYLYFDIYNIGSIYIPTGYTFSKINPISLKKIKAIK